MDIITLLAGIVLLVLVIFLVKKLKEKDNDRDKIYPLW